MDYQVFYDLGNENFYLMQLFIENEGLIKVNGITFDFEELKNKINHKQILTNLPIGSRFNIYGVGYKFIIDKETWSPINDTEFLKGIADKIKTSKGQITSTQTCYKSYGEYLLDFGNELLRKKLENDYYLVPAHHRIHILGDMDSKDFPLTWAIDKTNSNNKEMADLYYNEFFAKYPKVAD